MKHVELLDKIVTLEIERGRLYVCYIKVYVLPRHCRFSTSVYTERTFIPGKDVGVWAKALQCTNIRITCTLKLVCAVDRLTSQHSLYISRMRNQRLAKWNTALSPTLSTVRHVRTISLNPRNVVLFQFSCKVSERVESRGLHLARHRCCGNVLLFALSALAHRRHGVQ